jgi:putative (di)nucleoside polyphosphate hydrolase
MDQLPLRPNVCLLIRNARGELFLGERAGNPGVWQFPQGGVEPGTPPEENVIREAHEELGAPKECFRIVQCLSARHDYDFRVVPECYRGKWRGQSQTFWVVEFLGADSDIQLDRCDQPELMNWKWCTPEEVKQLAEPLRLPGYLRALAEYQT